MSDSFDTLLETMRRLRDPVSGCPWDLEQTHDSLRGSLLEETYEAMDAMASGERTALVEELGDLLLHVIFHAQIGADEGTFTMDDVAAQLNQKLVRRHPHVFEDATARTATEVTGQWERLKAEERSNKGEAERSMLAGVSRAMPALAYAHSVLSRARRAGFDWDDPDTAFDKVAEEATELRETETPQRREEEFGDLLLALVAAAHRMDIDPEQALRGANDRFVTRFQHVEQAVRRRGRTLAETPTAEKLAMWEQAKSPE
ncbi:MAG: nucleoside triphosphate pyrophosphohydrolase [Chloroflexota bacterium]|nr:nucleoside triphosphate pyrophosphohydrolase [Chloroflexota bacterium]MDE2886396.1 nucleoside triphosphate pyrophosphohydrolase [Chloroflexota bacterium]